MQTEFEIQGALFDWHDPQNNCRAGSIRSIRNYCYLSVGLMLRREDGNSLSTALKLNDIIGSFKFEQTEEEARLVDTVLAIEAAALENMAHAEDATDHPDCPR